MQNRPSGALCPQYGSINFNKIDKVQEKNQPVGSNGGPTIKETEGVNNNDRDYVKIYLMDGTLRLFIRTISKSDVLNKECETNATRCTDDGMTNIPVIFLLEETYDEFFSWTKYCLIKGRCNQSTHRVKDEKNTFSDGNGNVRMSNRLKPKPSSKDITSKKTDTESDSEDEVDHKYVSCARCIKYLLEKEEKVYKDSEISKLVLNKLNLADIKDILTEDSVARLTLTENIKNIIEKSYFKNNKSAKNFVKRFLDYTSENITPKDFGKFKKMIWNLFSHEYGQFYNIRDNFKFIDTETKVNKSKKKDKKKDDKKKEKNQKSTTKDTSDDSD